MLNRPHDDTHLSAEALQALLDGELPSGELARAEAHVSACPRCAEELESWQMLFTDLGALAAHEPRPGFGDRVLTGLRLREIQAPTPLAARVRALLRRLTPVTARAAHLPSEVLQDVADGLLTARTRARAERHLATCGRCSDELGAWRDLEGRLATLRSYSPSEDFADRVMAGVALPRPVAAAAKAPARETGRLLAGARRLLPRTRRAWAALTGVAVTPAAVTGLLFYTVFSHPTLTPGALASYGLWQLADLLSATWSMALAFGLENAGQLGLGALLDSLLGAPMMLASGVLAYSLVFAVAVRVLYQNLVRNRSLRDRYARVSAS